MIFFSTSGFTFSAPISPKPLTQRDDDTALSGVIKVESVVCVFFSRDLVLLCGLESAGIAPPPQAENQSRIITSSKVIAFLTHPLPGSLLSMPEW